MKAIQNPGCIYALEKVVIDSKLKNIEIILIIGKTGSGKDTIVNTLMKRYEENPDSHDNVKVVLLKMHTTRPKRNEYDNNYIFEEDSDRVLDSALDYKEYTTVDGIWKYWFDIRDITKTVKDNNYENKKLAIILSSATIETIKELKRINKEKRLFLDISGVYINRDDGERYLSLIRREVQLVHPNFNELIRRIEADNEYYHMDKMDGIIEYTIYNESLKITVEMLEEIVYYCC